MDGLAAAAAVMAMAADSESEEAMELENVSGNENGLGATAAASGSLAATEEINSDSPIDRDRGAMAPKVMMLPQTSRPRHPRSPTHFLPSPHVRALHGTHPSHPSPLAGEVPHGAPGGLLVTGGQGGGPGPL